MTEKPSRGGLAPDFFVFTEKCTPIHLTLCQTNNYNIKDIEYITVQYK